MLGDFCFAFCFYDGATLCLGYPVLKSGNSYCRKGKYDWAISDYNKALELNPKFTEAYYNRGLAIMAKVSMTMPSVISERRLR